MYLVTVHTFSEEEVSITFIDYEYAVLVFESCLNAIDARDVVMIDNITGEVLWQWQDGEGWLVVNGTVL